MRIPGRNIWRAFRELDRFSDEQCRRFVRSANRLSWASAARGFLLFLLGAAILLGVFFLLGSLTSNLDKEFRSDIVEWAVLVPMWTGAIALSPLAVLLLRDWMLIRRIRRLFRTRGQCTGCRYSLIGLPPDKSLNVVCPECGISTTVDVSLGELAFDETGRSRFQPNPDAISDVPTSWIHKRKRFVTRLAVGFLIVATAAPLLTWAFYEVCLQVQARAASGLKSRAALIALNEKQAIKWELPGNPGLAGAIARTLSDYERIQLEEVDKVTSGNRSLAGRSVDASHSWDTIPPQKGGLNEAETQHRSERFYARAAARNAVDRAIREGVFAEIDTPGFGIQQPKLRSFDPDAPIYGTILPEQLMLTMKVARLNQARMFAARNSGDSQVFGAALRSNLLLGRSLRPSPILFAAMFASLIESNTLEACIAEFEDGARPEFVHEIAASLSAWDPTSSMSDALEGERLVALDCADWLFSDASKVRWGRQSAAVKDICDPAWAGAFFRPEHVLPLGWYWENRDDLNTQFDSAAEDLKLEFWQRKRPAPPIRFALVGAFCYRTTTRACSGEDSRLLLIRSVRVMIALEQFRSQHGAFPETLADITSMVNADDLRDPFSGKEFGYLKLDFYSRQSCKPATSRSTREILSSKPYFLYAFGHDGIDDFIVQRDTDAFIPRLWGVQPASPGKDLLLNTDWNRWEEHSR